MNALKRIVQSRSELAHNSIILTGDRVYGIQRFIDQVKDLGLAFIFVMLKQILIFHPLLIKSMLKSVVMMTWNATRAWKVVTMMIRPSFFCVAKRFPS